MTENEIIENINEYVNLLIEYNKKSESENKSLKNFCSKIQKFIIDLYINNSEMNSNEIGKIVNNTTISMLTAEDTPVNDIIVMSSNKIYLPLLKLEKKILKQKSNNINQFNILLLNDKFDKKSFINIYFDLKSINNNNQKDHKIYLEYLTTNNLNDLSKTFDINWINDMNKYISNLSKEQIFTIFGYTIRGDEYINAYLRNLLINEKKEKFIDFYQSSTESWMHNYFPYFYQMVKLIKNTSDSSLTDLLKPKYQNKELNGRFNIKLTISYIGLLMELNKKIESMKLYNYKDILMIIKYNNNESEIYILLCYLSRLDIFSFDKFWIEVINLYKDDLNSIINNSPELTQPLIVYRGLNQDFISKAKKETLYKIEGFVSTTVNIGNAYGFTNSFDCCLQRIILLPGCKCLFLSGISNFMAEREFLLSSNTTYYISNLSNSLPIYGLNTENVSYDNLLNVCSIPNLKIKTTDIIVVI